MNNEVAGRVVTGSPCGGTARSRRDSSARTELCAAQELVSGADQVGGETGPLDAPVAHATEGADRLDPAGNFQKRR